LNAQGSRDSAPMTACCGIRNCPHLVSRPRSRRGRRLRSHGGSQWPDGLPEVPGVSMDRQLLELGWRPRNECGLGHQIECGIFRYSDLGTRHLAREHQFSARRQCRGRHGQQLRAQKHPADRESAQFHRPRTRWSRPASSAESCGRPVSVGALGPRTCASCLSNAPDPMTWAPSAFTRLRSLASDV